MKNQIVEICKDRVCFFDTNDPISVLFAYIKAGKSITAFLGDHPAVEKDHAIRVMEESEQLINTHYQVYSSF